MSDQKPVITTDGNQRLSVIERAKSFLSDKPADFPKLTASTLMGGQLIGAKDERVRTEIDELMPRDLRARAVGAFIFKIFRDKNIIMLYDVYLLQRAGFVQLLKETMRPDSLSDGLTDKELERSWEIFEFNVQQLAMMGRLRRRKDWRG